MTRPEFWRIYYIKIPGFLVGVECWRLAVVWALRL